MMLFVWLASTAGLSASLEREMGIVRANIQTVEDMYQLIWVAIAGKRPIEAVYKGLPRLFCPHRWAEIDGASFGCCVTSMVEKAKADWKHRDPRQTGVAQRWRSSPV